MIYIQASAEEGPEEQGLEPRYSVSDVDKHLGLLVKDIEESGQATLLKKRVTYECGAQTQDIETILGPIEEIEFVIKVRVTKS